MTTQTVAHCDCPGCHVRLAEPFDVPIRQRASGGTYRLAVYCPRHQSIAQRVGTSNRHYAQPSVKAQREQAIREAAAMGDGY